MVDAIDVGLAIGDLVDESDEDRSLPHCVVVAAADGNAPGVDVAAAAALCRRGEE